MSWHCGGVSQQLALTSSRQHFLAALSEAEGTSRSSEPSGLLTQRHGVTSLKTAVSTSQDRPKLQNDSDAPPYRTAVHKVGRSATQSSFVIASRSFYSVRTLFMHCFISYCHFLLCVPPEFHKIHKKYVLTSRLSN